MNKIKLLQICFFVIIICTGCQQLPYSGETPAYYNDTCWVSDEPNIWFNNVADSSSMYLYGKAMTPDGEIDIAVDFGWFEPTMDIHIFKSELVSGEIDKADIELYIGECMITGTCEYGPEKCILTVERDSWYGDKYETIVFVKEEIGDD